MNTFDKFLLTALVILLTLLLTVFLHSNRNVDSSSQEELINYNQQLIDLINVQNQTIHSLEAALKSSKKKLCNKADGVVENLSVDANLQLVSNSNMNECQNEKWKLTNFELECENRYGLFLADLWRKNKQTWCIDSSKQSTLECYPYHQQHKKLDGRGPDLICEAKNFLIDFSKVTSTNYLELFFNLIYSTVVDTCITRFMVNIHLLNHHWGVSICSFKAVHYSQHAQKLLTTINDYLCLIIHCRLGEEFG